MKAFTKNSKTILSVDFDRRSTCGHGLTYTRYADDVTFSCKDKTYNIGQIIPDMERIMSVNRFRVNSKKTRVMRPHKRMVVTGIVINEKLGVPKYKWKNFRAKLHNLIRDDVVVSKEELQKLRGYAEWIKNLNKTRGDFFLSQIGRLRLQT